MDPHTEEALQRLKLESSVAMGDVWKDSDIDIPLHNSSAATELRRGIADARDRTHTSTSGSVIVGEAGCGKTHLVRQARMRLAEHNGFFIQLDINTDDDFWRSALAAFSRSLNECSSSEDTQLRTLLASILEHHDIAAEQVMNIRDMQPSVADIDVVVDAVSRANLDFNDACRDALRVLCIFTSLGSRNRDVAEAWLNAKTEASPGDRQQWNLHPEPRGPREIVLALTRIMALVGPVVLSVDQIDALADDSTRTTHDRDDTDQRLADLAKKLMDFKEATRRSYTIISCLPHTWNHLESVGLSSVPGRFLPARQLDSIPTGAVSQAILTAHVEQQLSDLAFTVPWSGWPVAREAFAHDPVMNPRRLLRTVAAHVQRCLDDDSFAVLNDFNTSPRPATEVGGAGARFEQLYREMEDVALVEPDHEDTQFPEILVAGIKALSMEKNLDISTRTDHAGMRTGIHVVARRNGYRHVIRGLFHSDGRKVKARFNWLQDQSGTDKSSNDGEVLLLRGADWKETPKLREKRSIFEQRYGRIVDIDHSDLRTCAVLKALLDEQPDDLKEWLASTHPASEMKLMRDIFGDPGGSVPPPAPHQDNGPETAAPAATGTQPDIPQTPRDTGSNISLGQFGGGQSATMTLQSLRKHVAIFAGSGSGKTVMLRRLVEECALQGVSAIVLDPNNDLARLGDHWPQPPDGWLPDDDQKAKEYLANTEVVVWTPRVEKGRPVSFQPLPDFTAVLNDVDEFGKALDTAVAILAPRAKVDGKTDKHEQSRAVLREVLNYCAHRNRAGLDDFLEVLSDLPHDVVNLAKAPEIAHNMAQTLHAARINDPLFGGNATALDPGELLTPSSGKRARVSVISLVGLPDAGGRQSFVNQLQMALFAWIKRYPATDRPLGGLFVMDEAQTFAPSGSMTACTESTLALASQARKYGLGLVFATQFPRGIHNQIVGNCATQLVGFLNSQTQVSAVKAMVEAKRAKHLEISALSAGEFYLRSEGTHHRKLMVPMCLSHHPPTALTADEVVKRTA